MLVAHARAMGEAAAGVSRVASGQSQQVEGQVAITASEIYSGWLLPPVLKRLRTHAPGIRVEIVASNAIRDLKRREADIAIRNARPEQPDLIARKMAEDRGGFYAAPDYLAELGPVTDPADLAEARFIGFDENETFLRALTARGIPVTEAQFPVIATTHPVHWEMARAGLGIGVGPCAMGDAEPGLQRVLPDVSFDYPVWLVAHRELQTSPRVRIVWDLLAEMLPGLLRGER